MSRVALQPGARRQLQVDVRLKLSVRRAAAIERHVVACGVGVLCNDVHVVGGALLVFHAH